MIMPKNFRALMKSQTSGGRSRHSQLIFQSSSIAQSSSTGPLRKAFSSAVSVAGASLSSFDQSGLPVKRSASHQTSPASSASRSVSDIDGNTPRARAKIGLVMKSRRKLMAISCGWEHCAILERPHMPKDHSTLAESMKIEVAFRVEDELKLIAAGVKLITVKRRVGSGKE